VIMYSCECCGEPLIIVPCCRTISLRGQGHCATCLSSLSSIHPEYRAGTKCRA